MRTFLVRTFLVRAFPVRALLLALCLLPTASAQPGGVIGRVVLPAAAGAATGFAAGYHDGLALDWRYASMNGDWEAEEALNIERHLVGLGVRALLTIDVGGALALGAATEPTITEAAMTAAVFGAFTAAAFNVGHNVQQGQPLVYFGEVGGDQLVRQVGEGAVVAAALGGLAGLSYAAAGPLSRDRIGTAVQVAGASTAASAIGLYSMGVAGLETRTSATSAASTLVLGTAMVAVGRIIRSGR